MALQTYLLIITINVYRLSAPLKKKHGVTEQTNKQTNKAHQYAAYKRLIQN